MLAVLRQYKRHCEWFNRQALADLIEGKGKYGVWEGKANKAEWFAKLHLYEYLQECGIDYYIDPYCDIGKPDLIVFCLSRIWKNAPFGLA
jgi:hypothetical protein